MTFPRFLLVLPAMALLLGCQRADMPSPVETAGEATPARAASMDDVHAADDHILFLADAIEWSPGPASLEDGAEVAVLEGDPSAEEVFTMRIKMPDGFHISPHHHPNVERVTVVSGTFLLGSGEEFDPSAVERMAPGSYASMPPGMRHYAIAEGETVIQLTSIGPWQINYVNPDDDPRLRESAR